MFRTVPPPQGDPCRRHDGTSLPHTAMSVGFLQPQKKRTVPPSVLYISRLFKIYSRTVDRPPDGGAVARGWTATPRPPLDDEPPRRRRRGGGSALFPPHPLPEKQRADAEICMYLLEASLSIPGSRVVPERVRALAWEPIQLRTSLVRGGDQTYSTYSTTDADILLGGGQTDRSIDRGGRRTCSRDEPTNLDTLHSVLAAPPRSPSSSRLAPVGHTTHAIHRRRRANDSVDDRGRCVLVSVDAVAPGPRGPRRSHCL